MFELRVFHNSLLSPVGETSRSRCNREAESPFIVGRGPVPRQRPRNPTIARTGPRTTIKNATPSPCLAQSNDRYDKNVPLTVGRGPVPRHASRNPAIAGDRPPRYGKKRPFTVGRGPVPRHASRIPAIAGDRPPRYEKKRPLTVGRGPVPRHASRNPTIAGDRPPRYGNIETRGLSYRKNQDQEVSPTRRYEDLARLISQ